MKKNDLLEITERGIMAILLLNSVQTSLYFYKILKIKISKRLIQKM